MRLGIDISKVLPPRDGIGSYCYALVRALMDADATNEYLLYPLMHPLSSQEFRLLYPQCPDNFRLQEVGAPDDDLDLFHVTTWTYPSRYRRPAVVTCYDLTFLSHPDLHPTWNKVHCLTGALQALDSEATFVAISRHTRQQLRALLDVPGERVVVIPPGLDKRFDVGDAAAARHRVAEKFRLRSAFILGVGTFEPRKNWLRLLEAYERLPRAIRDRHDLVLAGGRGWLNRQLRRRLRQTSGHVRVLGYVSTEDLVDLYRAAAVFVYPSLAEGFGLPVLEALGCGAPVLTSNTTSLPEVADDAAVYFDPTDAQEIARSIERVVADPELADQLRAKGPRQARTFSWKTAAERTLELYRRAARG